jgi:putative membrane protein insertion efficiency factor
VSVSGWHDAQRGLMFARASLVARLLIALVKLYQLAISPYLGRVCRFEPSCSRYALACLQAHGAARGSLLSVKRLCKCHPLHPGGWDPPPPPRGA